MNNITTLRPGILVSLSTALKGNVSYYKRDIDPEHYTGAGTKVATWETTRETSDPAEHEEAVKVRSAARACVTRVCYALTGAGTLLCPQANEAKLAEAIAEAHRLVDAFNTRARCTQIGFFVWRGRVEQDDVEAVRAINSEVRDLIETMSTGITKLDVEAVRAAADKAKRVGIMLSPEAKDRVQEAIAVAREAAIRIRKAGEQAATEIDAATLAKLESARVAFLDLEDAQEIEAPVPEGRSVELDVKPERGGENNGAQAQAAAVLDLQ